MKFPSATLPIFFLNLMTAAMEPPKLTKSKSAELNATTINPNPTLIRSHSEEKPKNLSVSIIDTIIGLKKFCEQTNILFWTTPTEPTKNFNAKILALNSDHSQAFIETDLLDWKSNQILKKISTPVATYSQDDSFLATFSQKKPKSLIIWELGSYTQIKSLEFDQTPQILLSHGNSYLIVPENSQHIFFSSDEGIKNQFVAANLGNGTIDKADIFLSTHFIYTVNLHHNRPLDVYTHHMEKGIQGITMKGHENFITKITHSSNMIGTASDDKTVRLWDPNTAKCIASLIHPNGVTALALSSNYHVIAGTRIPDGKIYLWDVRKTHSPCSATKLTAESGPSENIQNIYKKTKILSATVCDLWQSKNGTNVIAQTKWYDQPRYSTFEGSIDNLLIQASLPLKIFEKNSAQ